MGGASEERDVSLSSGCQVAAALRDLGHEVVCVDPVAGIVPPEEEASIRAAGIAAGAEAGDAGGGSGNAAAGTRSGAGSEIGGSPSSNPFAGLRSAESALREADVAFPALHGGAGEDGTVQAVLQALGIPYAGSGPAGCALAMDKDISKRLFRDAGVATPDWVRGAAAGGDGAAAEDAATGADAAKRLGLPMVVKPVAGGSSVRLSVVSSAAEADSAAEMAGGGSGAMYESHVRGREFTVGILDAEALPVVEIEPVHDFFDFQCKYEEGMAVETAPARISPTLSDALRSKAMQVHRLLRLDHFSRVDFIVDPSGKPWCLEANALPGLTSNSLLPKAARAAGIDFPVLCDRICKLGVAAGVR